MEAMGAVEGFVSFVFSDDFTIGYLILLLINSIAGHSYQDLIFVYMRNQMEAVLEGEFRVEEEERCKPSARVTDKKTTMMSCTTTVDMAMIAATGQCSICLQEFKERQKGQLLPECQHLFHPVCIDEWLRTHSSCPLCRSHAT